MPPKKKNNRIGENGYRLCDPLPKGEVLIDNTKHEWILGIPIASGGFGEIYSARRAGDRKDDYVIKLDDIGGPLFQEMNFYMRAAKESQIKDFMSKHRLKFLGMPRFIATGIHDKSSDKSNKRNKESNSLVPKRNAPTVQYRFLVMQRFGDRLEDWVKDEKLTTNKAIDIAVKMIDVLQYIHSFGYIHADIKGSNILKTRTGSDWYLVDFGLAERYCDQKGVHRSDKPDKKRANNGTVEYRSRDAHIGCLSRRSDMECLSYNLIEWLYGDLPWISVKDQNRVQKLKEDFFQKLEPSLRKCFGNSVPNGLKEFLRIVDNMEFDGEPDYQRLKNILLNKGSKRKSNDDDEDEEEEEESEELIRKSLESESESTVESIKLNSPPKRKKVMNQMKNKKQKQKKYIELSDSEVSDSTDRDSSVLELSFRSPPKSVTKRKTPNLNRRSPRTRVTKITPPLLFGDEEEAQEESEEVEENSLSGGHSNETEYMREIRKKMAEKAKLKNKVKPSKSRK